MSDNQGLTPFELTLKVWGAYAGDSLGPRVLDAIATHVRRLAPSGTPVAALELLAMQVVLTCQPIFDPRTARSWVKQYDIVDDQAIESAEAVTNTSDGTGSCTDRFTKDPDQEIQGRRGCSNLWLVKQNGGQRIAGPAPKQPDAFPAPDPERISFRPGDRRQRCRHHPACPAGVGWAKSIPALSGRTRRCQRSGRYLVERIGYSASQPGLSWWPAGCGMPPGSCLASKGLCAVIDHPAGRGQPSALRAQAMAAFVASGDPGRRSPLPPASRLPIL